MTSVGDLAFSGCIGLTSVAIPSKVTSIGDGAFSGCSGLSSMTILCSPTSIGSDIFSGCDNLKEVLFDCETITSLLSGRTSLEKVTIKESVTSVGDLAFSGCIGLTSVAIPNSVTSIGNRAFWGCSGLTSIIIPDNVTIIANNAFDGCKNFVTINIGKSVTSIGERAFANIDKLTDVYCYAEDVPYTDRTAFENSYTDYVTLHVPYGALEMYKATGPWNGFKSIVGIDGTQRIFNLIYKVDGEVYKIEEIKEGEAITPEAEPTKEGYTFSGWSEIPEVMPAYDVTVIGTFSINSYKLTYMIDDKVYKEVMYEYGATIIPEPQPEGDYARFEWIGVPETMPANDFVVYASYETGIIDLLTLQGIKAIYAPNGKKLDKPQKGLNIILMNDGNVKRIVVK